ncbi:MAG: hypothetical protein ACLSUW_02630 [Akkermansia sp.]
MDNDAITPSLPAVRFRRPDDGGTQGFPARKYPSSSRYLFDNDTRDQSTHFWSVMWMQEAIRITRHGGWLMVFSDWRQLP